MGDRYFFPYDDAIINSTPLRSLSTESRGSVEALNRYTLTSLTSYGHAIKLASNVRLKFPPARARS